MIKIFQNLQKNPRCTGIEKKNAEKFHKSSFLSHINRNLGLFPRRKKKKKDKNVSCMILLSDIIFTPLIDIGPG